MRSRFLAAAVLVTLSVPAVGQAADATVPVKEIMDITVRNWAGEKEWKYIFDEDMLTKNFSKAFIEKYREASKKPAYESENGEAGDPFGYDVITYSQDGCPIEDLKITPGAQKDGTTDVGVTFRLWSCLDEEELKKSVNEIRFDVITENGKPVIADMHHVSEGERDSVMAEMTALIAGE